MPRQYVNPEHLEGEALENWYRRTPSEIEIERSAAERAQHREFFGQSPPKPVHAFARDPAIASGDDSLWISDGRGGYRRIRPTLLGDNQMPDDQADRGDLPEGTATFEPGHIQKIGNPYNPRLIREWERAEGKTWPRTADGRPYDVAHVRAIADGGTNTLDNIRPMDPGEHRASHKEDQSRWGKRASIARAFGGKVERPAHAPQAAQRPGVKGLGVRGLGVLGLIPALTGILSGRIRTDTPPHFWGDVLGYPIEEDPRQRDQFI